MKKVNLIREYVSPEMEIVFIPLQSNLLQGSGNNETPGGGDNPDTPWPQN